MSLIKCIECGKEISDTSEACIHCGSPLKKKIKCPECQNEINKNDVICKNCGKKLKEQEEKEPIRKKEPNKSKKIFIIIGAIIAIIIAIYFSTTVKVPYLYNIDKDNAINILSSNELIPEIFYEYDDYVEEGKVIDSYPYSDERVSKNSIITLYISKGPKSITASDSTIHWYNITNYAQDDWEFYTPKIEEGYMYIDCETIFQKNFTWSNSDDGTGFGNASISDTFSKTVPVEIKVNNSNVTSGEQQDFTLKIPVNDLDVKKPTTLYLKLVAEEDGKQFDISINFAISW